MILLPAYGDRQRRENAMGGNNQKIESFCSDSAPPAHLDFREKQSVHHAEQDQSMASMQLQFGRDISTMVLDWGD
jgi:hypothetical protein